MGTKWGKVLKRGTKSDRTARDRSCSVESPLESRVFYLSFFCFFLHGVMRNCNSVIVYLPLLGPLAPEGAARKRMPGSAPRDLLGQPLSTRRRAAHKHGPSHIKYQVEFR